MRPLYSVAETRDLEENALRTLPGLQLMQRAARAALWQIRLAWPEVRQLLLVCGSGNNGGDGFLLAALGRDQGLETLVLEAGTRAASGDAARARSFAADCGLTFVQKPPDKIGPDCLLVDALLGTGFRGELRPDAAKWIDWMNAAPCPVVALDVPSGLNPDTGTAAGCVRADMTVTFITDKRGFYTRGAAEFTGKVQPVSLDLPASLFAAVQPKVQLLSWDKAQHVIKRPPDTHKNREGHTLITGGDRGMGGAVLLAAEAAMRAGAGLVSVASQPEHSLPILARRPEVMNHPVTSGLELRGLLGRYQYLVLGPGLGRSTWSEQLYQEVIQAGRARDDLHLVLDADALNILAAGGPRPNANWIMTPHPGEAARLLGTSVHAVQSDRFAAAEKLHAEFGATVVLKGAGSLVAGGSKGACEIYVCPYGNPGLATAGTGDLLAGVLGALLAQGMNCRDACITGVMAHSLAGDAAAEDVGQPGLLAGDLLLPLARLLGGRTDP